jgi:hypothetical protein
VARKPNMVGSSQAEQFAAWTLGYSGSIIFTRSRLANLPDRSWEEIHCGIRLRWWEALRPSSTSCAPTRHGFRSYWSSNSVRSDGSTWETQAVHLLSCRGAGRNPTGPAIDGNVTPLAGSGDAGRGLVSVLARHARRASNSDRYTNLSLRLAGCGMKSACSLPAVMTVMAGALKASVAHPPLTPGSLHNQ